MVLNVVLAGDFYCVRRS
ncbi:hypothetical protein ACNFU3_001972 [Escherichia coli]